jgi:hypothetical protein
MCLLDNLEVRNYALLAVLCGRNLVARKTDLSSLEASCVSS